MLAFFFFSFSGEVKGGPCRKDVAVVEWGFGVRAGVLDNGVFQRGVSAEH